MPPSRPVKPRPRKRWFVIGALLLVAAVVVFGVGLWQTVAGSTQTDAIVDATSGEVEVGVEAGQERMLYADQANATVGCLLTDADGQSIELDPPFADTTVSTEGRTWTGIGTFTSDTSEVTVRCDGQPGTLVRIGAPLGSGFAIGLVVTILGPMVLGLAGLAVLITTTVLWLTRKPSEQWPSGPPAPPSPPPPAW